MIKDAQQQHGLRHGDFQRYRGYCTRRIGRLRKVLRLPQGEKRHFKKRDVQVAHVEGVHADVRFLHIPLIMAERAWAYAMQLRQESNTEPRKRFHLVGKMRKACSYALQLQELCKVSNCIVLFKAQTGTRLCAEIYLLCILFIIIDYVLVLYYETINELLLTLKHSLKKKNMV